MDVKQFEKSKELFDAALKEFGNKGYEKASLNNILKDVGISKGTFYYHFKNKEDMYAYLISMIIEAKKNFFTSHLDKDIFTKDFFTVLETLIQLGLKFAKQKPNISQFSEQFLKERNSKVVQKIFSRLEVETQSSNFLDVFIETAYQKNEIREDIPKDFIKNIINYLFVHLTDFTNSEHIEDFENVAQYLIKFIKTGITKS